MYIFIIVAALEKRILKKKKIYWCSTLVKNQLDYLILKLKDTMEWKRFPQQDYHFDGINLRGDIYKEHLIILCQSYSADGTVDVCHFYLRCWNTSIRWSPYVFLIRKDTNSWKNFKIKRPEVEWFFSDLIVFKDSLLTLGESDGKICLATFNLSSKRNPPLEI